MTVVQPGGRIRRVVPRLFLLLLLCSLVQPVFAQIEFPATFAPSANVLTENERNQLSSHYQAAGQKWAEMLGITEARSIEILISIENISTANASSANSVFFGTFDNRNTFEQGAAYELRTGVDFNGAGVDVLVNIGLDYVRNELWFDPDPSSRIAPVPVDKTDAMSSALHELGHALAYSGWASGTGVPPADFWSTFDRWMSGSNPTFFEGPASMLVYGGAPELTTNNINHWGNAPGLDPLTDSLQSSQPIPNLTVLWQDGAPIPRNSCPGLPSIDLPSAKADSIAAINLLDQLMNGVAFVRGSRYHISALDIAALRDAGLFILPPLVFQNGFEN